MTKVQARRFLDKKFVERNVMELAQERVKEIYDRFDHVCVGFSGGKDSTVCMNLCLEEARSRGRTLYCLFYDEEAVPYQTEDYVRRVANLPDVEMQWLCLPVKHVNACSPSSPWWYPWAPEEEEKWVRPLPPEGLTWEAFPEHGDLWTEKNKRPQTIDATALFFPPSKFGQTAYVMGIRASESMTRLRAVTRRKGDNWIISDSSPYNSGSVFKVYPIYDWATEDVWTAPSKFCNTADAPIWMGDLSFRPIGDVRVGDEVIGWDSEEEERTRLVKTRVTRISHRIAPVVKITTESGRTLRCTRDHEWQICWEGANANWRYGEVSIGTQMAKVIDPTPPLSSELQHVAGWLGGMYDGEGSYNRIYQSPIANEYLHTEIGKALDKLGIPNARMNENSPAQRGWVISGGRQHFTNFLNWCKPNKRQLEDYVLSGRFRQKDRVIAIEDDGIDVVVSLTTETENYVVWGYASHNCWDVNESYDLQELHGFHGSQQRIAPPFGAEPMQMLSMYKTCFPELWERMYDRVPGAATAARYSRTELYAFRGRPQPAPGETWKDLIVRLLERHAPETREEIRERIAGEIQWHYSQVSQTKRDPILPVTPHPITGMSIEWLAMIAMRGDLKKRKVAGWQLGEQTIENREKVSAEYRKAYEQWERGELESV